MAQESGSNAGVIAMLVVIVMLLVGGFLYFQMNGGGGEDKADIEVNLPDGNSGGS
jgi:hypothetical protein